MHSCTSVCGKTLSIASGNPFSPSTQAMKMSVTPRFFSSVTTCSQNLAPSVCAIHNPRTSLNPSIVTPNRQVDRFVPDVPVVSYFELDRVQVHDRVDRLELPVLPRLHLIKHFIGYTRDQTRSYFYPIDLFEVLLNLAGR